MIIKFAEDSRQDNKQSMYYAAGASLSPLVR